MPEWIQILIRAIVMIGLLFLIAKLSGKKSLANEGYFQAVLTIVIGFIAAYVIIDVETPLMYGVLSIITIFAVVFGLQVLSLKSKQVRDVVDGKGAILIKDGKVLEDNMKQEQYTSDDLLKQLRTRNIFKVNDVEFAVLEPTGELNVMLKKENQPITLKDLKVKPPMEKEPQTVIMDGEVLDEPLATLGLNRGWLKTELDKKGAAIENIYIGQVDSYGQLYIDMYDDKIQVPAPTEKPLLLATIRKCQADLEGFALATDDEETKKMYRKNAQLVNEAINKVTKHLS